MKCRGTPLECWGFGGGMGGACENLVGLSMCEGHPIETVNASSVYSWTTSEECKNLDAVVHTIC